MQKSEKIEKTNIDLEDNIAIEPVSLLEESAKNEQDVPDLTTEKILKDIESAISEYIRPAIEEHEGSIELKGYRDGIVYIKLSGACSDCPSAGQTVEYGIKSILKMCIPEVVEVISEI